MNYSGPHGTKKHIVAGIVPQKGSKGSNKLYSLSLVDVSAKTMYIFKSIALVWLESVITVVTARVS